MHVPFLQDYNGKNGTETEGQNIFCSKKRSFVYKRTTAFMLANSGRKKKNLANIKNKF